jgi:ribose/xylose/arabinose/galactoside ABC-type transport system permease subunit
MIIQNAMNHLQVVAYWQYVFTGLLTRLAVAAYGARSNGMFARLLPAARS